MGAIDSINDQAMPEKQPEGRDELNLAEFPLCALAHRVPADQKTLHFTDRVWDQQRGQHVVRELTVTGSDAFGLPTALDDEVLLGLIQVTKARGFEDRKIAFTRHELLRTLGWGDDAKSYRRVEESLNRWTGVTLYFQRAWWNKTRQCWMDEKFHVLDNVWLCHRSQPAPDIGRVQSGPPQSAIVWNEVVFRSFQAGNLKSIDFEFYKSLDSALAKRLYRFLDKRFFRRSRWEFDLHVLACEHAGLSRGYDTGNLKRKLRAGIAELERRGFLRPLDEGNRFRKVRSREWKVVFEKALAAERPERDMAKNSTLHPLATHLIQRGVSRSAAERTVRDYPVSVVREQTERFDWLLKRKDPRVSRNPPGYLLKSIQDNYSPPHGFVKPLNRTATEGVDALRARIRPDRVGKGDISRSHAEESARRAAQLFWNGLPLDARTKSEQEAFSTATAFQRDLIERGGSLGQATRNVLLTEYAISKLARRRDRRSP